MSGLRSCLLRSTAAVSCCWLLALPAAAQSVAPALFSDLKWRLIGPFRGGRTVAVGGVPGVGNTFYFGAVDGGVWKTTDAGTVWTPLFDKQPVASIGALEVSRSNPEVIYVGTGESDIRSDLASGAGVYKSVDGGDTWAFTGLSDTRQISRIAVDPMNADIVHVGALGHAYGPNPDRGVFKTVDGGRTWRRTLYQGPELGVADLVLAAAKPNVLFASLWNAHRPPWSTYAPLAGPGSGIYRSLDAGETWQPCIGHGLPGGVWGRAGLAVSADGRRVYALIDAEQSSGLYASNDAGQSWTLVNADARLTSRAWYFSRIAVDPNDADTIYVPNVALLGSVDGGKTLTVVRGAPGGDDYHELWVDPKNRDRLVLATDQGTTISLNRGRTWSTWYNQPTAQIYHVTTDDRFPYIVYGAQQDSGGVAVPSRTDHRQITPRDWFSAAGSESGYFALDPKNADIVYASGTYGTVSRWDRRRSLAQDVTPWPVSVFGTDIALRKFRAPWTPPLVFSPVDKTTLYLGTQYVLKTMDGGLHWQPISPDLTGGKSVITTATGVAGGGGNPAARNAVAAASPTPENAVALGYGTLATVAPSYLDKNVLWTGSDTGIISLTRDGGRTWSDVTPPGMQVWSKIALIEPSHFGAGAAYVAVDRHRMEDRTPYVYRTRNYGKTWELITNGLQAPRFVRAVREDPYQAGLLYAGTEFGIDVSFDEGGHWQPLQLNLPVTSVRDLVVHGDDLIAATHGRSFWILDDITALRQAARAQAAGAFLYAPAIAVRIDNDAFTGTPLPPEEPTAENPPNGAVLDYYLPANAQTVELRIRDSSHKLVRRFTSEPQTPSPQAPVPIAARWLPAPPHLEATAGMHRFVWGLDWGPSGAAAENEIDDGEGDRPRPPRVVPGTYRVELAVDAQRVSAMPLTVVKDPRSPAGQAQFLQQFETGMRIFRDSLESRRTLAQIAAVKRQLDKTIADGAAEHAQSIMKARQLRTDLNAIIEGSSGLDVVNLELTSALNVVESSDRPAPSQALEVYERARAASLARREQWEQLKSGPLAALNQELQAQGLPPVRITTNSQAAPELD